MRFCSELHSAIGERKKNEAKFTIVHLVLVLSTEKEAFSLDIVSRLAFYRRFPSTVFGRTWSIPTFFLLLPTFLRGKRVVYVIDATYRSSCTTLALDSLLFCTAKTCMYILCSWGQLSMAFVSGIKIRRTMRRNIVLPIANPSILVSLNWRSSIALNRADSSSFYVTSNDRSDSILTVERGCRERWREFSAGKVERIFSWQEAGVTSVECNLDFCSREKRWI